MNIANVILKKILWIWKMTREEYGKLCISNGMIPYREGSATDTDYGFYINNTKFIVVCGYRSEEHSGLWEEGSMIFYNNGRIFNGEYYTDCKKSIPSLIKEIKKAKRFINLHRKRQIERDFNSW